VMNYVIFSPFLNIYAYITKGYPKKYKATSYYVRFIQMMLFVSYLGEKGEEGKDPWTNLFEFQPVLWVVQIFIVDPLTRFGEFLNRPYKPKI